MKKLFFCIVITASIGTACSNESTKEKEPQTDAATHTHEDGSTHQNHDTIEHHQEEFQAQTDSTVASEAKHEHSHGDDHSHSH